MWCYIHFKVEQKIQRPQTSAKAIELALHAVQYCSCSTMVKFLLKKIPGFSSPPKSNRLMLVTHPTSPKKISQKFSNFFDLSHPQQNRGINNLLDWDDKTSCVGGRHNMPVPCKLTFDLESCVRVMCDMGCLCANFSLPRPLCSRFRTDVCDRQTDRRHQTRIIA